MALWDNIQGKWSLSNGIWTDASGNGNTLTPSASAPTSAAGHGGGANLAAAFVYTSSQDLSITDAAQVGLDIIGSVTISFWCRPTSVRTEYLLAKGAAAGTYSYFIHKNSADMVVFRLSSDGTSLTGVTSTVALTLNAWSHVVCVYNGTDMRIYINNVLACTPVAYTSGIHNGTAPFMIGSAGSNYFDGRIDDYAIWSRALSSTEVSQLFGLGDDFLAPQDFTAFTETDPNSRYTVTANRIAVAGLDRSEDAHVAKDFGAAAFNGTFTHKITVYVDSASASSSLLRMAWGLANAIDDVAGLRGAAENYLELYIAEAPGSIAYFGLSEYYGSNVFDDSINLSINTPYYLTIVRDEAVGTYGTLYCYIYSNITRTTLVDTLTITLRAKIDFRYLYAANSFNNSTTGWPFTGYVENLNIPSTETIITIPTATFNFIEYAPAVVITTVVNIPTATFNFTGYAPTIVISTIQIISIPTATFNFSRYAPTVHTTNVGILIPTATFNFTEYAPTVHLTQSFVIPIPTLSFPFTTHALSVLISNSEEEISWGLFDTNGAAITGVVATIKVRSRLTGYILDWSDNIYKLGGGASPSSNMQEMDAANFPGYYYKVLVMGAWADGWYTAATTYAGTPAQNGATEFLIRSGQMVDSFNSSNLDAPVSSRATIFEIEGSSILAKEATLTDLKDVAFGKWVVDPTGKTLTLYRADNVTVLKTFNLQDTGVAIPNFIGRTPI